MHKHLKDKKTRHTEKVYSEEEFNQRLNSELQRRLKQKEDEKAEAVKEAQKLAKMNKDQQLQYENEKLTKQLEEYKVRDAKSQMKAEARLMLNKEGIDVTEEPLLDMLLQMQKTLKRMLKLFLIF